MKYFIKVFSVIVMLQGFSFAFTGDQALVESYDFTEKGLRVIVIKSTFAAKQDVVIIGQTIPVNVSGSTVSAAIINWLSAYPLPSEQIQQLKNIWISSGSINVSRVGSMSSTGVNVSTSAASQVSAKSSRRAILIEASVENSGKVFLCENNANITTNGVELSSGQSWVDENYTGVLYLQASGIENQNVRVQEIYE